MHDRTCSLNDPLLLESHLRPKIALLLGLSLRMFSIRTTQTFLASIWIPSMRSRLSGDLCFSATNFHHVSRHLPSRNCQALPVIRSYPRYSDDGACQRVHA